MIFISSYYKNDRSADSMSGSRSAAVHTALLFAPLEGVPAPNRPLRSGEKLGFDGESGKSNDGGIRKAGVKEDDPPPYLVSMVMSAPTLPSHVTRAAMRKTWLTYSTRAKTPRIVKHFFLVGIGGLESALVQDLQAEQNEFGDLVLLDGFRDSYQMLSAKLLLGIESAYRKYGKYAFFLKVDEDSFVRLDKLLDAIDAVPESDKSRLYMGQFMRGAFPHQEGTKWDDPKWNLQNTYPPYCLGGGYVVSGPLLWTIAANKNKYAVFQNEDANMGLWLSPFNVSRNDDSRVDAVASTNPKSPTPPRCKDDDLIEHRVSTEDVYQRDRRLRSTQFRSHCAEA